VAVLRTHAGNKGDGEQLTAALTDLIARPEKGRQPAIRQALAHYDDELVALVIAIERTLSAEQRARAVKRMQVYADDFTALSKRKSAGTPS
jgi:putative heme iron utilization protein